jgi:hypothetical protein
MHPTYFDPADVAVMVPAPLNLREMQEASEQGRDEGMGRAAHSADQKMPKWTQFAYTMLIEFIRQGGDMFMGEDVRVFAYKNGLPQPPHERAWGSIMHRAASAGLLVKGGFASVKNPKAHRTPATVWIVNHDVLKTYLN